MSMYVRIKRKNQTFFYHVEPSDSFLTIKQRLADGYKLQPNQIALYSTADKKREFVDLATISDQSIKNDDIIYLALAKEGGGGWEEINVDDFSKNNGPSPVEE